MAKKKSVERFDIDDVSPKASASSLLMTVLKILGFIFVLPAAYGFSDGFYREFSAQSRSVIDSCVYAVCLYLILHIFICKPTSVYKFGENIMDKIFGFTGPLRKFFTYGIPFYGLIIFIYYLAISNFFHREFNKESVVFVLVFAFIMHLTFVAEELREQHTELFRAGYFLYLFLAYTMNLLILGLFFYYIFDKFSLMNCIKFGYDFIISSYALVWRQLFVIKK